MSAAFVAIVNYRTGALVIECLESLAAQIAALDAGKVIVVDNKSDDDSIASIGRAIHERGWSAWAEVLPMPRNGGFAYGCNAAIERARRLAPDLWALVLLNPDTSVRPGALATLLSSLRARADAGICGAAIENVQGQLTVSAHGFPSPLGELEAAASFRPLSRWLSRHAVSTDPSRQTHRCDWVSGACMAIRREVLDHVGPLDERFFLYFEEVDFCRRARRAGWACWFVADARVMHLEGASTGIREARRRLPAYWFASRRRFFVKAYGVGGLVAADALWTIGRVSLTLRRLLGLGGRASLDQEPKGVARDLLWGDLRAAWRGELALVSRER